MSQLTDHSGFRSLSSSQQRGIAPPCHQNSSLSSAGGISDESKQSLSVARYNREIFSDGGSIFQNRNTRGSFTSMGSQDVPRRTVSLNDQRPEPRGRRATSSVASLQSRKNLFILPRGPAQQLLRPRHPKSYTPSSSRSLNPTVSSRDKAGGGVTALEESLVRSHTKKRPAGVARTNFPKGTGYPAGRNNDVRTNTINQERFYQLQSELENAWAERQKISEKKMEEKFKRLLEVESLGAADSPILRIQEDHENLRVAVEKNTSTLLATKQVFEEKLKCFSDELGSSESRINIGIHEMDTKLVEMKENADSHSKKLDQAAESHLERISTATSSSIKAIQEYAESASVTFRKKVQGFWGTISAYPQAVVQQVIGSAQKEQNEYGPLTTKTYTEPEPRASSSDNDMNFQQGIHVASGDADTSSYPRRLASLTTKTGKDEHKTQLHDRFNQSFGSSKAGPPNGRSTRRSLKRSAQNEDPIEEQTPTARSKKPCVTPSGEKVKQNLQHESHSLPIGRSGRGKRAQKSMQPSPNKKENKCYEEANVVPTAADKTTRPRKRTRSTSVADDTGGHRNATANGKIGPYREQPSRARLTRRPSELPTINSSTSKKDHTPPPHSKKPCVTPSGEKEKSCATTPRDKKISESDRTKTIRKNRELKTGPQTSEFLDKPCDEIIMDNHNECTSPLSTILSSRSTESPHVTTMPSRNEHKNSRQIVPKEKTKRRNRKKWTTKEIKAKAIKNFQLDDSLCTSKF